MPLSLFVAAAACTSKQSGTIALTTGGEIASTTAGYALRSLRWEVFQRNLGPSHFWRIYAMTLAGFSAIFLLGRAGEPARPILLARKEKLPLSGMFGFFVLERIFDAASAAVINSSAKGCRLVLSIRAAPTANRRTTAS